MTDEDIAHLHQTRRLPAVEEVKEHAPGGKVTPDPWDDERVIFYEHFSCGFGLPASDFFRRFLTFYGLQPHHLGPNSILQHAVFVAFCEGYIGLLPMKDLWCRLFYLW